MKNEKEALSAAPLFYERPRRPVGEKCFSTLGLRAVKLKHPIPRKWTANFLLSSKTVNPLLT
jgi:hypothetical protein